MKQTKFLVFITCMIALGCISGSGYIQYNAQGQVDDYEDKIHELTQEKEKVDKKRVETRDELDQVKADLSQKEGQNTKVKKKIEKVNVEIKNMKKEGVSIASSAGTTFMPEPIGNDSDVGTVDNTIIKNKDAIVQNSLYYFGTYGGESIAWRVLQDDGDRVLLVTEYCIDAQPYYYYEDEYNVDCADFNDVEEYREYIDELDIPEITWETSELREFCNDTFYNVSFTDVQRQRIIPTSVETNDSSSTTDNVFILSGDEWDTYCTDPDFRIGYPTTYAISQGILVNDGMFNTSSIGKCSYWVRGASTSYGDPDSYADWIDVHGRWRYNNSINDTGKGVRPVIWITK